MNAFSAFLLSNVGAAGAGAATDWNGGRGLFAAVGTFGGTTVTLEYLGPDGATWLPVKAMAPDGTLTTISLTTANMYVFELPPGKIRANATGGAPVGLFAKADRIPY